MEADLRKIGDQLVGPGGDPAGHEGIGPLENEADIGQIPLPFVHEASRGGPIQTDRNAGGSLPSQRVAEAMICPASSRHLPDS